MQCNPTASLPPSLPPQVFLVGTAHVSSRSVQEVRDMIRLVKPGTVFVELCQGRAERMRQGQPASDLDFLKVRLSRTLGTLRLRLQVW